jgi:hypothetical protein
MANLMIRHVLFRSYHIRPDMAIVENLPKFAFIYVVESKAIRYFHRHSI